MTALCSSYCPTQPADCDIVISLYSVNLLAHVIDIVRSENKVLKFRVAHLEYAGREKTEKRSGGVTNMKT